MINVLCLSGIYHRCGAAENIVLIILGAQKLCTKTAGYVGGGVPFIPMKVARLHFKPKLSELKEQKYLHPISIIQQLSTFTGLRKHAHWRFP